MQKRANYTKTYDMNSGGGCYNPNNLYAQGRDVKEDKNGAIWSPSSPCLCNEFIEREC